LHGLSAGSRFVSILSVETRPRASFPSSGRQRRKTGTARFLERNAPLALGENLWVEVGLVYPAP